jgi:hypothetical protein
MDCGNAGFRHDFTNDGFRVGQIFEVELNGTFRLRSVHARVVATFRAISEAIAKYFGSE